MDGISDGTVVGVSEGNIVGIILVDTDGSKVGN